MRVCCLNDDRRDRDKFYALHKREEDGVDIDDNTPG